MSATGGAAISTHDEGGWDLSQRTRDALFRAVEGGADRSAELGIPHKKLSIVGVGQVGMACAFAAMNQALCSEIALVDVDAPKLRGECMDLLHGRAFSKHVHIEASTDYAITRGSHLVVITAGVRQRQGETRLDLAGRNLDVLKVIVPAVVRHSPDCVIMVVSNPVDIMTYLTWKLSGFPSSRVFGSGTSLDSSRFRTLVAARLGTATTSVHGLIVGEHGDTSVPVWSQLNVAGVRLARLNPKIGEEDDPEKWNRVHTAVVRSAADVIESKGYTNWAIGLTAAYLIESVLRNEHRVIPVSTRVRGVYGIEEDVFLSVPAVIGARGIRHTVAVELSESEQDKLRASAKKIHEVQAPLEI